MFRIDVAFANKQWMAEVGANLFSSASLMHLMTTAQRAAPRKALLFVVDNSTIDGNEDAAWQFRVAREHSGARVILSVQEF